MKIKLTYILLPVITFFYGMLYYSPALIGLGIMEILVPLCSAVLLWQACKKSEISLYLPVKVAEKNQKIIMGLLIDNHGIFPIGRIKATLFFRNRFYPDRETCEISGMAGAKARTKITAAMQSDRCGSIRVELQEVWAEDLLRIFRKKIKVKIREDETVAVMPEFYVASLQIQEETGCVSDDWEGYDPYRPGDDPGEIFQIREYQMGDRIQSIHWKASARTDNMMVKDFSYPVESKVVFFLNLEYEPEAGYGILDEFLEAALAISHGILEKGIIHYLVWFNKNTQDIQRVKVEEPEDLYMVLERLFESGPYPVPIALGELYTETYREESSNTHLLLNLEMELWRNDQIVCQLCGKAKESLQEGEIVI